MKRVWVVGGETRHTNGYKFHVWFLVLNIQGVKILIILVCNEQTSSELIGFIRMSVLRRKLQNIADFLKNIQTFIQLGKG